MTVLTIINFEEFTTKVLDSAWRSIPTREDRKEVVFQVSDNTLSAYEDRLSTRLGFPYEGTGHSYAGIPVVATKSVPEGVIHVCLNNTFDDEK